MKGRSKITFTKNAKTSSNGLGYEDNTADQVSRADWPREAVGDHTVMGNPLINVARRMKANARSKGDSNNTMVNHKLNATTMEAYSEPPNKLTRKTHIMPEQRRRMQINRQAASENDAKQKQIKVARMRMQVGPVSQRYDPLRVLMRS